MRIIHLMGFEKYDVLQKEFMYGNTRLYSLNKKLAPSDYDEIENINEYLFYNGIILHDSNLDQMEVHYFKESRVFHLSNNGASTTLFYLTYNSEYTTVSCYKLNCLEQKSYFVSTLNLETESGEDPSTSINVIRFIGINDRYAYISYSHPNSRFLHSYIIDSLTGEWIAIDDNPLLNSVESMIILNYLNTKKILIKTGQYTENEKKRAYEMNEKADEHIILIEVDEFICGILNKNLNLELYIVLSASHNEAIELYKNDKDFIVQINNFVDGNTKLETYNIHGIKVGSAFFPQLYQSVFFIENNIYATVRTKRSTKIYDLRTGLNIFEIMPPDTLYGFCENAIITQSFNAEGDLRICQTSGSHSETLVEGNCLIDQERELIIVINREEP